MKDVTTAHRSDQSVVCVLTKSLGAIALMVSAVFAQAEIGEPEKDELKFGFIKLLNYKNFNNNWMEIKQAYKGLSQFIVIND